jgi:hypothetical protein
MVRSLGVPVKSSDKREPNEADAFIPKTMHPTLTTSKAIRGSRSNGTKYAKVPQRIVNTGIV